MQLYQAAVDFIDAELEISIIKAIGANPEAYWEVQDLLPKGSFAAYREVWEQVAEAVEADQRPTAAAQLEENGGEGPASLVAPAQDIVRAARRLGDLYQRRLLAELHQAQLQALRGEEPATELIADLEARLVEVAQAVRETRSDQLLWASDLARSVIEDAEAARQRREDTGNPIAGLSTGLSRLDTSLNGLNEGLYVLAAPPGYGKTSLALQLACEAAREVPVVYVTYENTPANLTLKALCRQAHVTPNDVVRGTADVEKLRQAVPGFLPVAQRLAFVDGSSKTTVATIRGKALQAMHRHGKGQCLVVVDYLQRMAHLAGYQSLRENVGALTLQLRELSRRLESPVMGISAQSRQGYRGEKSSPYLETLKESGDLEYSADVVLFLKEVEETQVKARPMELLIAKNRYGEAGVSIPLVFKPAFGDFREQAKE